MELEEAVEYLKKNGYKVLDEDFGIGVGAPCGLDQGIPHGGDGKGCCPQRMGLLYQRSPYSINPLYKGVPDAHHPQYWLNQIPKKKRKKLKRRKRKLHESADVSVDDFKEACWKMYFKFFHKNIEEYRIAEEKVEEDFKEGFSALSYPATRAACAGRVARQISSHLNDFNGTLADCLTRFKKEIHLLRKLFKREDDIDTNG